MRNPILSLVGKTLVASLREGSVSFSTEDGWELVIYNRCEFIGDGDSEVVKEGDKMEVLDIVCKQDCIEFHFQGESSLYIDLSPLGYQGPEALQLISPDGDIIVWN